MSLLTEEHRLLLARTASLLAGRVVRLVAMAPGASGAGSPADVPRPLPVPVKKHDLQRFAAEHGYSKARAGRVWNRLYFTAEHEVPREHQGLPPVRYLGYAGTAPHGGHDDRVLDLRSVYERLRLSGFRHEVWRLASRADVDFLIQLVNERMEPEVPLARSTAHSVHSVHPAHSVHTVSDPPGSIAPRGPGVRSDGGFTTRKFHV